MCVNTVLYKLLAVICSQTHCQNLAIVRADSLSCVDTVTDKGSLAVPRKVDGGFLKNEAIHCYEHKSHCQIEPMKITLPSYCEPTHG
jgi:hypothetical protein